MKVVFNLYREILGVLPFGGRRFMLLYSALLASLSVFDAAALGLLALVIGPLSVGQPVTVPLVGTLDTTGVVIAILAICALMITKGGLSVAVMWWCSRRTARYEVAIADRLFRAYIHAPWLTRLKKNSVDMLRFSDGGVDTAINSFLRPGATLPGEAVSLVVVVGTLAIVQPAIAVVTLVYILLLGAVLYLVIARHSRVAGEVNMTFTMRTSRLTLEIVSAMKEIALRNREDTVADVVKRSRDRSARARANAYFLGQVPRYVLESGLVGGFVVVGVAGFLLGGQQQAITAVALFGLAGFRMAPSVIRSQAIVSQMLASAAYPRRVLEELRESEELVNEKSDRPNRELPADPESLRLSEVTFRYSDSGPDAVRRATLEIPFGSTVAFVGASGSGKSTMIDIILSLLEPSEGQVSVDGIPLTELTQAWRRRVAYVPQDVALFDSTIAANVALSWSGDYDPARVRMVLEQAQIWDLVAGREGGIESQIGERGLALSGGQRQRLGIARALYADPLVLILDEATSALDTQTEAAVSDSISELSGHRTVVIVAHRLATIKNADKIFFMRDGEVADSGTFRELITRAPDFARQAQLAGLA